MADLKTACRALRCPLLLMSLLSLVNILHSCGYSPLPPVPPHPDANSANVGSPTAERVVFGAILSVVGNIITLYSYEDMASIELALNEGTSLVTEDGAELPLTRDLVGKDAIAVAQDYRDGHIAASLIMVLSETYSQEPGGD